MNFDDLGLSAEERLLFEKILGRAFERSSKEWGIRCVVYLETSVPKKTLSLLRDKKLLSFTMVINTDWFEDGWQVVLYPRSVRFLEILLEL